MEDNDTCRPCTVADNNEYERTLVSIDAASAAPVTRAPARLGSYGACGDPGD